MFKAMRYAALTLPWGQDRPGFAPPTSRGLQKRVAFLTPLCLCGEGLPSGAQGLAVMQVPNPQPEALAWCPEAANSGLSREPAPSPGTGHPWTCIPSPAQCCSGPHICRLRVFSLQGGSCPGPWAADPYSSHRPQCWLGCHLGTHVHRRVCLGLPIPGPASSASPPSLPPRGPCHPTPIPQAQGWKP